MYLLCIKMTQWCIVSNNGDKKMARMISNQCCQDNESCYESPNFEKKMKIIIKFNIYYDVSLQPYVFHLPTDPTALLCIGFVQIDTLPNRSNPNCRLEIRFFLQYTLINPRYYKIQEKQ